MMLPGGPVGATQAAPLGEPGHGGAVEGPERIARRLEVVPGLEHPLPVAPGQEQQRPVGGGHLVQEHRDVHGPRLGHLVVAVPRAEVLVPLPDLAVERGLGVHLVLVHVHGAVNELHDRLDEARVAPEAAERLVVGMGRERGARDAARLAPHLVAVEGVDLVGGGPQHRRLLGREARGEEQVALLVEPLELVWGQLHDESSSVAARAGAAGRPRLAGPLRPRVTYTVGHVSLDRLPRPHVRLLRHPDRLGGRHLGRPAARDHAEPWRRRHPRRRAPRLRAVREPAGAGHARTCAIRSCSPACTGASPRASTCGRTTSSTRPSAPRCRTGRRSRTPPTPCASSSGATASSSCPTCTATASPPRTGSSGSSSTPSTPPRTSAPTSRPTPTSSTCWPA